MICVGLSRPRLAHFGIGTTQFISDPDVIDAARRDDTTRAVQAMRKAHRRGLLRAPSSASATPHRADRGGPPDPRGGLPAGAGDRDAGRLRVGGRIEGAADGDRAVPWVAIHGRKGGSTLVVAAIHALLGRRRGPPARHRLRPA